MRFAMSSNHLAKDSTLPPYTGKLRVYNMRFCPYGQRLMLVLNAKNIDYEVIYVDMTDKPQWFVSINPSGKVPILEVAENVIIFESLITAEYVPTRRRDEMYPQKPLSSKDPLRKAQDKCIIENFNKSAGAFKAIFLKCDTSNDYFRGLEDTQNALVERGTAFFHGDKPGMVDYMIWPWFERFHLMVIYCGEKYSIDWQKFKILKVWMELMKQDTVVKSYFLERNVHSEFIKLRLARKNPFRSSL